MKQFLQYKHGLKKVHLLSRTLLAYDKNKTRTTLLLDCRAILVHSGLFKAVNARKTSKHN